MMRLTRCGRAKRKKAGEPERPGALLGICCWLGHRQESEHAMPFSRERSVSRRNFCLCCVGGALYTATGGWLTPREAFAEARGLVSLIKDSAAVSPLVTHKLRNDISVLEGSGGNIAVLTGPHGEVLIAAGSGVSR